MMTSAMSLRSGVYPSSRLDRFIPTEIGNAPIAGMMLKITPFLHAPPHSKIASGMAMSPVASPPEWFVGCRLAPALECSRQRGRRWPVAQYDARALTGRIALARLQDFVSTCAMSESEERDPPSYAELSLAAPEK